MIVSIVFYLRQNSPSSVCLMRQNRHYKKIPWKQSQVNLCSIFGSQHYNSGLFEDDYLVGSVGLNMFASCRVLCWVFFAGVSFCICWFVSVDFVWVLAELEVYNRFSE